MRVPGFDDTQAWFQRVHQHELWQHDGAATAVAKLSPEVLYQILEDLGIIRALLASAVSKGSDSAGVGARRLSIFKLAPLMGLTVDELDLPLDLTNLSKPNNPARIAISRLMMRAAILHTAIAISPSEDTNVPPPPPGRLPRPGIGGGRAVALSPVRIQDGRQVALASFSAHWAIARAALDLVGPPPASADAVRLWYRATASYMQDRRDYAALRPHLVHAREILKADATIFLLSGAASENLAAPAVQAAIAESDLGDLSVGSPSTLRDLAERDLRRAVELDPDFALARLRLGRVMQLKARHADAADLLRAAEPKLSNPVWRYFAALYLGRAEHALGHGAEARAAYQRAIDLFPKAQSPRLALAEVAWLGADQAAAVSDLANLFAVVDRTGDPWWTYDISHVIDLAWIWEDMRGTTTRATR